MNHDGLAVIFDMDGVLVDSYRAHFESWRDTAAGEGLAVTEADFALTFGRTSREIIAALWGADGYTEEQILEMDDRKEAAYREILAADFPAMAGVADLLKSLAEADFALAVGSSGPPDNINMVLDRLRARDRFDAVVSGMDVTRGKPDPRVFLLAAERLGISPARCAVVEDAPLGVVAAKAAGMTSIGFASTGRTREELADADLVIDSLAELSPKILRELIDQQYQAK